MREMDKIEYINRYNNRLKKFGNNPITLGWGGGKERQEIRFSNLINIGVKNIDKILDVGCGFADLYGYLIKNNIDVSYTGIDINDKLLEVALDTYPEVDVRCIDIVNCSNNDVYDWVFACGIFNAKLKEQDNLEYFEEMLKAMYSIAKKGIAVDFMHTYVDFQADGAYHTAIDDALKIARKLSWRIKILMSYLPYECMLYLYKS